MRHGQTHYGYNGQKHSISFGTSSSTQQTNETESGINTVRLTSDQDVYVTFETDIDATSSNGLLVKAGIVEYFAVEEEVKLNAIGKSASGTLEIAEMTL